MSTTTNPQAPTTGSTARGIAADTAAMPAWRDARATVGSRGAPRSPARAETVAPGTHNRKAEPGKRRVTHVDPGLTMVAAPLLLRDRIQLRALEAANRFGVIRTFDIAACCFPERPFKASLTAAQRAMRGLVKAGLLKRYRTDRQQHVYGLTRAGARFLEDRGVEARATVQRVADMTNPEHLLWSSFIVTCCEARGLKAQTESELLRSLHQGAKAGLKTRGLLQVSIETATKKTLMRALRPDAIAFERDGVTWFEVDRSRRADDRAASLRALFCSVGHILNNGRRLMRVVVLARSERILANALSNASKLIGDPETLNGGNPGRAVLRQIEGRNDVFEVWYGQEVVDFDGTSHTEPAFGGHVIIQMLPVNLPKFRLDARNVAGTEGWFPDNYLPYVRPAKLGRWLTPTSPLL